MGMEANFSFFLQPGMKKYHKSLPARASEDNAPELMDPRQAVHLSKSL